MDQHNAHRVSRRSFLATSAAATAFTIVARDVLGGPGRTAPSDKIALAGIGVGGQGSQNMIAFQQIPQVQVVAVCDVVREGGGYLSWNWAQGKDRQLAGREPARKLMDEMYAKDKRPGYQACRAYNDYRELLDKEDVDAVMIGAPDHQHAVITMAALKRKKHVYCEKPLTYSIQEARTVTQAARAAGVATHLGNHGQATEEARITCELIWDGAIGPVREVHVWSPARFWAPALFEGPAPAQPVPDGLDWNLWLGPAPERPYNETYTPWNWRNWWDFGTGLLGDLGCHKMSTVFKALKLTYPISVEACSTRDNGQTYPLGVIAKFEFPARGDMPPVTLNWYDGGLRPAQPTDLDPGRGMGDVIYIGEKGKMMGHRPFPDAFAKTVRKPPRTLPRSTGHYQEFIDACKGGPPAGANFPDHAGVLTETCMLGNIGVRCPGAKLLWDGPNMKITNHADANKFLRRPYREGWTL